MITEVVSWSSISFIFYAYFDYPLLVAMLPLFKNWAVKNGDITAAGDFIITAHNHEKRIPMKIKNASEQELKVNWRLL